MSEARVRARLLLAAPLRRARHCPGLTLVCVSFRSYDDTGLSSVSFHPKYPLFATGGVDGNAYVFHGMVYSDLLQNPLIVPVKKIHAHKSDGTEGVTGISFHPTQPWLFTCGMDSKIQLFTELN